MIRTDMQPRGEYPYKVGDTSGDWELIHLSHGEAWWENSSLKGRILFSLNKDKHYVDALITDYITYDARKIGSFAMTDYRNTLTSWAVDNLFHPEDPIDLCYDFSNPEVINVWFAKNRKFFNIFAKSNKELLQSALRFILSEYATDEMDRMTT